MRKRGISLIIMVVIMVSLVGCGTKNDGETLIGIGQFAEHGSLDNCREGFIKGLSNKGYVEGDNLKILYDNAQTDGGMMNQIVTNFIAKKVDLITAIATPIAQSAYGATKNMNLPVIYTAVTDPVVSGLADSDRMPLGNITGTSDKLPVEEQLAMIRAILPDAKKIGIMYTTSESNSLSTLKEYKEVAPNYGFEIIEAGVSATADIPLVTDNILDKVDCLNNLTDNTVVNSLPTILDKAGKKNIPVFGSEIEQVKIGCIAAMGLDYYDLGIQTGEMAAMVLSGEKDISEMKFEIIEEFDFYANTEVASRLGVTIPEDMLSGAREVFDSVVE